MIIYVEKKAKSYPLTLEILSHISPDQVIEIEHYKNLFDKNFGTIPLEECIILAVQEHISLFNTPTSYGFEGESCFCRFAINCIFDCRYCYLKGAFKNRFPVLFVNLEDMQDHIRHYLLRRREEGYQGMITLYGSNYCDLLALEPMTHFHEHLLPFFEQFEQVRFETRTKSAYISCFAGQNGKDFSHTEIAFSLSPQLITTRYEKKTASLKQKLQAAQTLLDQGFTVGLRFLPLLPVEDFEDLYTHFLQEVSDSIDINRISSVFLAPLIYNPQDYSVMWKREQQLMTSSQFSPEESILPFLEKLHLQGNLMKMDPQYYQIFQQIFASFFPHISLQRDYQ